MEQNPQNKMGKIIDQVSGDIPCRWDSPRRGEKTALANTEKNTGKDTMPGRGEGGETAGTEFWESNLLKISTKGLVNDWGGAEKKKS